MNFLPIAGRELRVAARKRSTFWVRVGGAGTALAIGTACLILTYWERAGRTEVGTVLFSILTWLSFVAGISAGLFFTSDALSEEKRDGTLGLLFLTDLRGYDVVFGKLLATSLRGFYGLLAVMPIVAVTMLMGGVTGAQYWKSSLALINGLFFSLAAGLIISAVSRDSQKALAGTLLALLALLVCGPVADGLIATVTHRSYKPVWSVSSPAYVLMTASAWGRAPYWTGLFWTQFMGWLMLAGACALVPRTWQQTKRAGAGNTQSWAYAWKYGSARRRQWLRRKLLPAGPVVWLACRERWQSLGLWAIALTAAGALAIGLARTRDYNQWILWNYAGGPFTLVLYLLMGSQACRFGVEARQSGFLELLLVSPIAPTQLVRGQWRGLLRMFAGPLLLLVLVHTTAAVLSQISWHRLAMSPAVAAATAAASTNRSSATGTVTVTTTVSVSGAKATATTTQAVGTAVTSPSEFSLVLTRGVAAAACTVGNLAALWWFGMWMGMTSRTANLATLKTLAFVQVIPWLVISFGTTMIVGVIMSSAQLTGTGQPAKFLLWWPLLMSVVSSGLALLKDIVFIISARANLYSKLREQAAGVRTRSSAVAPAAPPPVPPLPGPSAAPQIRA